LPNCPKCGNKEVAPTRSFTVIVEPSKGERGMTERRVGMYTCSKCGTKFPTVISRQKYLIVAEEQLNSIQSDLTGVKKENEELTQKVGRMEREQRDLQATVERNAQESDVRRLETKLEQLQSYVSHLRKEKDELEQRASRLR
jgi:predicted RNase H-like nuclease (RuvC/YqgF family)